MKFTIKELVESKDKRESFKDFLAAKVHTAEKLEKAAFGPFQLQMPSAVQGHKLWSDCRESVFDLMVLKALAETDEGDLEEKLDSLYSIIEKLKEREKKLEFAQGFQEGFEYSRLMFVQIIDNLYEHTGLMDKIKPLSEKAKALKDADKKAGIDLKSGEEYEELAEENE